MPSIFKEIPENSKICIYGTGETGIFTKLLLDFMRDDIKVICYLDSFKSDKLNGLDIVKIDDIDNIKDQYDLIFICSNFSQEIENSLKSKGIFNFKSMKFIDYSILRGYIKDQILDELYIKKPVKDYIEETLNFKQKNTVCGKHLLINTMQKSGTQFLLEILTELTGYKRLSYIDSKNFSDYRTEEYYSPDIVDNYNNDIIVDCWHRNATYYNMELIKKFNFKTVVLVRNIFDIIPSFREYLLPRKDYFYFSYLKDYDFYNLSADQQHDIVIRTHLGWLFEIYVSWYKAKHIHELDVMFVTYDDLVDKTEQTIQNICEYYELDKTTDEIINTINHVNDLKSKKKELNFNKGIKGRGRTLLTEEQKQYIVKFAKPYVNIDFSLLGIHSDSKLLN